MIETKDMRKAGHDLAAAARDLAAAIAAFSAEWNRWLDSLTPAERAEWDGTAFPEEES